MIQLHDPHAQPESPNDYSAMQMLAATRAIMDLIYKLCGTTYDLLYLDHGCGFCWFAAGAAIIRFLKARMDAGDEDEVARLEQELGVVKCAEPSIHLGFTKSTNSSRLQVHAEEFGRKGRSRT